MNMIANLASVYGSYLWPSNTAPRYAMVCGLFLLGSVAADEPLCSGLCDDLRFLLRLLVCGCDYGET